MVSPILVFSFLAALFGYLSLVKLSTQTRSEIEELIRNRYYRSKYEVNGTTITVHYFNINERDDFSYKLEKHLIPSTPLKGSTEVYFQFRPRLKEGDERLEDHFLLRSKGIEDLTVGKEDNVVGVTFNNTNPDKLNDNIEEFILLVRMIRESRTANNESIRFRDDYLQ